MCADRWREKRRQGGREGENPESRGGKFRMKLSSNREEERQGT